MKSLTNIIYALCLFLLGVFPLGVLVRFTPFHNVNVYPQDITVGLIAILLIFSFIKYRFNRAKSIFLPLIVFNLIAIISLFLNNSLNLDQIMVSCAYLLRFDAYVLLLFLGSINFSKKQVNILKKTFIISSVLVVALGFIQYYFYNDLRNLYYLGWDEHLYRLFSSFLDPNYAGVIFSSLAILIGGYFIFPLKRTRPSFYHLIFLSTIIALVLTYSRSALLGFFFGFVILLVSLKKIKQLIVASLVLLAIVFILSDFSVEGMNPFRIASSEARIDSIREGVSIFSDNPIMGVGFNAYRYAQIEKGFREGNPSVTSNADAGTDNSFIFVLATTGISGFLVYLILWLGIIKTGLRVKEVQARAAFIAIISSLLIASQFINALFYAPIMLWTFFYTAIFLFYETRYSDL